MYLKLAVRNAKRSAKDYMLYFTTMFIMSMLIMFSNLLSVSVGTIDGAQANAVPLIIALVMMALLHYINGFMLRRRVRELSTYMLLGMKKHWISTMFFIESLLLGLLCFLLGMLFGGAIFAVISRVVYFMDFSHNTFSVYGSAASQSLLYFLLIQILSLAINHRKIVKLQLSKLISEDRRNELSKRSLKPKIWTTIFFANFAIAFALLRLITHSNNEFVAMISTSVIMIPILACFYTFYKAIFHLMAWFRMNRHPRLYKGNRIYFVAQWLSKMQSNIILNTVLSICLFFSAVSFTIGVVVLNVPDTLFYAEQALWMAFAQISLSIVFLVTYFSIHSVRQIVDARENRFGFRIMSYLGKRKTQLSNLVFKETFLKFLMPVVMCILLFAFSIHPLNALLNSALTVNNILPMAILWFSMCFIVLYIGFSFIAYRISTTAISQM